MAALVTALDCPESSTELASEKNEACNSSLLFRDLCSNYFKLSSHFGNVKHLGNHSQAFHEGVNQADFRFLIHQLEPPPTYGDVVRARKVPNDSSRRADTHVADDREEPPIKVANKMSMSRMSHPNHIHMSGDC